MKRKSILTLSLAISIGLSAWQPALAVGKPYMKFAAAGTEKTLSVKNNSSVKIYLDPPQKKVHVIAKENKGKQIDFFIFDLEGTLVHNHKMKTKDHHRVNNLSKGTYVYRVFCGDEETASGQLEIK